ncbi:MAG: hypothetical protein AABY10_06575, partial [Nanoarchaeota archaeon]
SWMEKSSRQGATDETDVPEEKREYKGEEKLRKRREKKLERKRAEPQKDEIPTPKENKKEEVRSKRAGKKFSNKKQERKKSEKPRRLKKEKRKKKKKKKKKHTLKQKKKKKPSPPARQKKGEGPERDKKKIRLNAEERKRAGGLEAEHEEKEEKERKEIHRDTHMQYMYYGKSRSTETVERSRLRKIGRRVTSSQNPPSPFFSVSRTPKGSPSGNFSEAFTTTSPFRRGNSEPTSSTRGAEPPFKTPRAVTPGEEERRIKTLPTHRASNMVRTSLWAFCTETISPISTLSPARTGMPEVAPSRAPKSTTRVSLSENGYLEYTPAQITSPPRNERGEGERLPRRKFSSFKSAFSFSSSRRWFASPEENASERKREPRNTPVAMPR